MSLHLTEEEYGALMDRMSGQIDPARRPAVHCLPPRGRMPATGVDLPTEEEEQIALFDWAGYAYGKHPELALLFHIPNGGSRGPGEAGRFRAMGVKAGVPDLFLPVPWGGCNGLFIELKRQHGGRLSDEQRDWLDDLNARGTAPSCATAGRRRGM